METHNLRLLANAAADRMGGYDNAIQMVKDEIDDVGGCLPGVLNDFARAKGIPGEFEPTQEGLLNLQDSIMDETNGPEEELEMLLELHEHIADSARA